MRNDVLCRQRSWFSFRLSRDSTRAAINLQLTESDCAVSSRLDTRSGSVRASECFLQDTHVGVPLRLPILATSVPTAIEYSLSFAFKN